LAELAPRIEGKEEELAALRAKADALWAKVVAGQPETDPVPLPELLGRLPKDRWPKDKTDALRLGQAYQWYAKYAIGRRVVISVPASEVTARLVGVGKWTANVNYEGTGLALRADLMGSKWMLAVFGDNTVKGLTDADATRLRAIPLGAPVEVRACLKEVELFVGESVLVRLADPKLQGIGP
jgi:hypothetical protein